MNKTTSPKLKTEDGRNIIDHYWYWNNEEIKAHLDLQRMPFSVLVSNLANDFNIGSVIRNSNCFLAKDFFYYGRRQFDRRGTVGMHHYERITHLPAVESLSKLSNYNMVAIDNIDSAIPIEDFVWPENPILCFGQEQIGLPKEILDLCKSTVYIRQYGCVRSLNVGCASAIAMQDFVVKYCKTQPKV